MNFYIDSHYCGWNMDPLFHTWDEGIVKTMDFTRWTNSEEGEDRKVGRKDDNYSFLECTLYNSYPLPFEQTISGDYYAALLECFNNILKNVPNDQIQRIPLRIAFSIFISCELFLVFQTWRNGSEERDSPLKSSSSPKQKFILKSWTNHVILTVWKS